MEEDESNLDLDIEAEPPAKKSKLEECSSETLSTTDAPLTSVQEGTNPVKDPLNTPLENTEKVRDGVTLQENQNGNGSPTKNATALTAEGTEKDVLENEDLTVKPSDPSDPPPIPSDKVPDTGTPTKKSPVKTKKKKKKRKKLKPPSSEETKALTKAQTTANRKAANLRKNIKDILKTDSLGEETLAAQREEAERRERMNLKLQQLKLMQAQQAAAAASAIPPITPMSSISGSGSIPICDFESILNEGSQETYSAPRNEERGLIDTSSNYYQNPLHPAEARTDQVHQDEIVILSDDDDETSTPASSSKCYPTPSFGQSYVLSSELRSHLAHPPRFPLPSSASCFRNNNYSGGVTSNFPCVKKSQDHNVISISSGDEDSENCDKEVSNATLNRNGYNSSTYFNINRSKLSSTDRTLVTTAREGDNINNDSDDDCVVLSPTPENDDAADKDERNLDELNVHDSQGRVLANVGHPDEDPDIFLPPQVARIVKPHQIGGIRFLYDNVVESVDRFSTASGFGCILAHSMGLGKTIQAVSFCDVFLRATNAKTVLIIVPINTIQNWLNEFNVWLPTKKSLAKKKKKSKPSANHLPPKNSPNAPSPSSLNESLISETLSLNLSFDSTLNLLKGGNNVEEENKEVGTYSGPEEPVEEDDVHLRSFEVYVLNETVKTLQAREKIIGEWSSKGGVMLIGYEMYRMLALKKLKKSRKPTNMPNFFDGNNYGDDLSNEATSLNNIHTCLVDPGPDLVICDEGHRIKNSGASISQALKAIRTKRRVVLTGYPLQNNLMEYWCMVDFIRPNYLGSKVEFSNMFERPISNGQCVDSTPEDRKLMRFRSHVLHSLLEGFVQRRSHAVLHSALPEKQEWVFLLKMTTVQYNLYKEFMAYLSDNLDGQCGANPIKAFAVCCKIWNHPDALYNVVRRKQSILDDLDLDEVNGTGGPAARSGRSRGGRGVGRKKEGEGGGSPQISFFDGSGFDFRRGGPASFSTTKSGSEGLSLDWAKPIFENYIPGILENGVKFEILFEIIKETVAVKDKLLVFSQTLLSLDLVEFFFQQKFNWTKNVEYYRLDGSTTGLEREKLINSFNSVDGVFVFLVSTRAGSLGINLIGANRVVVLDASWNPCHDCQAVCRIYRYGQTKPCQIYRFVSDCTLEKRIYDRQINKRGMSDRVVDEMNPNAQFKSKDVSSFLVLKHDHLDNLQHTKCELDPEKYSDKILQNVLVRQGDKLTQAPFEHESLLIDQKSQRLSATEKRLAHRNYLSEKRTSELQSAAGYSYSRPSYAAYYPKGDSTSSSATLSSSGSRRSPFFNTSSAPASLSGFRSSAPFSAHEDKFERHVPTLRSKGICVQSIVLKKDSFLADPSGGPDMYLMSGEKIYVLRSDKGTYLRISNGKLIAVRNTPSNSRFPCLNVPSTQELAKEQLQTLVYSFLKLPGHSSYSDYGFNSRNSSYSGSHPTEQPLPPSASFFSQSKNHLQVTNTRSNSGGDVTMWQPHPTSSSNLVRSPSSSNDKYQNSEFSKPQSLNALLDSTNGGRVFNSNLEKLSYLAKFSNIISQRKDTDSIRRTRAMLNNDDSNSSNSNSAFPPGFMFPAQQNPDIINQPFISGSTPPCTPSDLELIPISQKKNGGGVPTSPIPSSYLYSPSVSISTTRAVEPDDRHQKSNEAPNPSFYEDFTITVKSPKYNSSNDSRKSGNGTFVPSSSRSSHESGSHFNFDRGEYLPDVDLPSPSGILPSTNITPNTNLYDGNTGGTDFPNFNQYYSNNNNNGSVQHNINSNCEDRSSSSTNQESYPVPLYPNQGV